MTAEKTIPGILIRALSIALIAVMMLISAPLTGGGHSYAASSPVTAAGRIKTDCVLRKDAKVSSKKLGSLAKDTPVIIKQEVFTSGSAKAGSRWYKIRAGKMTGFVKVSRVTGIKYGDEHGMTVDDLDCMKGPGKTFGKRGTVAWGTYLHILLPAKKKGSNVLWYKVKSRGKTVYLRASLVARTTPPEPSPKLKLKGRPRLAKALLSDPTKGGRARYVYTFNSKNCSRRFAVKGSYGVYTAQGMAFTGKRYYVLFGDKYSQCIVTYSSKGKRLRSSRFSFAIGHPNGMTWDPKTRKCYIFKGHQKRIYTWDPKTKKFGRSKTPFNASGGAYDPSTKMIYASSLPCMYTYSSDGKFKLDAVFGRCSHSFTHSAQDCGAGGGFLFHAISGNDHQNVNYLDVYRVSDRKYLGSIKVTLGEIESAVVDKKGYVELLINKDGATDYVWKTPLNVKDLQ